jgi:arsenate reductase (thioredoxin)
VIDLKLRKGMRPKVAFNCVHNSCRSQIAEALGRLYYKDCFESWSAGTEVKDRINPDAVRIMKERFGIDMEASQRPKLLEELPPVDIVITMGCNVQCPALPSRHREDWGLQDPTGQGDEAFQRVIDTIERKIKTLAETCGDLV